MLCNIAFTIMCPKVLYSGLLMNDKVVPTCTQSTALGLICPTRMFGYKT